MIDLKNMIENSYTLTKKTGNNFRKILYFKIEKTKILPGQFYMLNYYGCQKPFSVSSYREFNDNFAEISFIIEDRGECSKKMIYAKEGDYFGLTGPLGNGFEIEKFNDFLLISGGIGIATILFLANYLLLNNKNVTLLIGERTKENIIYDYELNNLINSKKLNLIIYTDDDSMGNKGFVTKDLNTIIKEKNFDSACICGPEIMMNIAIGIIKQKIPIIQICMERYMKCGFGLCGSCVLDDIGLRVCVEGPVLNYNETLINCKEFSNYHRNSYGIIEKF